jgi:N-acetylneuraminate synthase
VIAFGYLRETNALPGRSDFADILLDRGAWTELNGKVTLLHCTTEYPASPHSINLRAIATLRSAFGLPVGFSDHSRGIHVAAAAVALGATVIEKHLTLDRSLPGPDHRASIEPDELAAMIASIRDIELALGDGRKVPAAEEIANRSVARRSLVTTQVIRRGERFSHANLGVKRPGDGIPPIEYWAYLGTKAERDYTANEVVKP